MVGALPVLIGLLLYLQPQARAAMVINFDNLNDGDVVANQYPGLTFSNATILTAGISLNEFEFPPHSGSNVVSDNGGPISILFASPITSFSGFLTYAKPLILRAFDDSNNQIGTISSAFFNNEALSGDLGSSPNELLQISFSAGISSVIIAADPAGGSLALDDLTYLSSVPEPSTAFLFLTAGGLIGLRRRMR